LIEEAKHKEQLRQIEKDKRLKREELEAKKKIKEQIEADKRARKEKVHRPLCDVLTVGREREISSVRAGSSRSSTACSCGIRS
jgi:hypothetical protein